VLAAPLAGDRARRRRDPAGSGCRLPWRCRPHPRLTPQPENFALFEVLSHIAWLAARPGGGLATFALAGLFAGVATLSRTEGALVLIVLLVLAAWDRMGAGLAGRAGTPRSARIPAWAALSAVGLYLVTIGPWWLRQLAVFGSISPSTASGKVLYLRDFSEWNSITTPATLDYLLGMGAGAPATRRRSRVRS
jgi:hypothetical protein